MLGVYCFLFGLIVTLLGWWIFFEVCLQLVCIVYLFGLTLALACLWVCLFDRFAMFGCFVEGCLRYFPIGLGFTFVVFSVSIGGY